MDEETRGKLDIKVTPGLAAQHRGPKFELNIGEEQSMTQQATYEMIATRSFKGHSSGIVHRNGAKFMTTASNRRLYLGEKSPLARDVESSVDLTVETASDSINPVAASVADPVANPVVDSQKSEEIVDEEKSLLDREKKVVGEEREDKSG